ncbi:MAG TPA: GrpB family protein [Pseudonocardiaceae bacterium]|nr:GrpB family protein [Pseudonocardiaceae bacterium]
MPVTIVEYDLNWPNVFASQRDAILAVGGDLIVAIEHVGSTAVPGLAAKPVIDIFVSVTSVDDQGRALIEAVRPLGYEEFDPGMPGRLMCTRDEDGVRTQHLHIVSLSRWDLLNERLLRDWLLTHPVDRDRYAALKKELAGAGHDGLEYTRAKTSLVQELVDAARAARGLASVEVWEE